MRKLLSISAIVGFALPALAFASFDRNLTYGSKGEDVIELQEFFTDQGLYSGPITGNLYSLTVAAVKKFQKRENIAPISGYFGPKTRTRANSILLSELSNSEDTSPAFTSQNNTSIRASSTASTIPTTVMPTPVPVPTSTPSTPPIPIIIPATHPTTQSSAPTSIPTPVSPYINYTLKQASYYHFGPAVPIANTNVAYELAYIIPSSLNSPIDEIKISLGGNINSSDVALVYLDKTGVGVPDYNGYNLSDVIAKRTIGYTTTVSNGVADIHLNPTYQNGTFPELVIVFNGSVAGRWTAATSVDFYSQGTKFTQNVSVYNPNPQTSSNTNSYSTPMPSSTPAPTPTSNTVTLWKDVVPTNDKTEGTMLDVRGYSSAKLQFGWTGTTAVHTCQYAYTNYDSSKSQTYYSTFLYFPNSGCSDSATIPITSSYLKIDAWTSLGGLLNATLLLQ